MNRLSRGPMSNRATENMRRAQRARREREANPYAIDLPARQGGKTWPKCRCCGVDLLLSNVRLGFCNVECRDRYEWERRL